MNLILCSASVSAIVSDPARHLCFRHRLRDRTQAGGSADEGQGLGQPASRRRWRSSQTSLSTEIA